MKIALFGGIFPGSLSEKAQTQKAIIYEILKRYPAEIVLHKNYFNSLPQETRKGINAQEEIFTSLPHSDLVLSVGGDGTFLRTAAEIGSSNIPVLGINTGRLGFLADVNINNIEETLDEIFSGYYKTEERSLLSIKSSDNTSINETRFCALNEIAILKQDTASMLSIHTYINGDFLTTYQSDGLILATPTGSTAYSLSVGGPILMPESPSFVLTPIAPHNLTTRPLVIHDQSRLRFVVESRSNSFLVSLDGQSQVFRTSVEIEVFKANYTLKVIKRTGHTFYETLRDKLMWGVDVRK